MSFLSVRENDIRTAALNVNMVSNPCGNSGDSAVLVSSQGQNHAKLTINDERVRAMMRLFDPLEEQFNLPATTVQFSHRQGGQIEMVG